MYHYISVPPANADAVRRDLSVTPELFEAHLAYLRQAGYETITMEQLIYALSQETPLPPRPIIISFDDGYRDHYENAFPLLRKYSYTGIFFVFTQVIDTYNVDYLKYRDFRRKWLLETNELLEHFKDFKIIRYQAYDDGKEAYSSIIAQKPKE